MSGGKEHTNDTPVSQHVHSNRPGMSGKEISLFILEGEGQIKT